MMRLDNTAIAAKLSLGADLLELTGADRYRVLSYRKAATAVRSWPEQLHDMDPDGLTVIPGIGDRMAATLRQLLERGSFDALDRLSEKVPATLADVMRVSGVGAKRAMQLYERAGIADLAALEAGIADGSVGRLGGFGAKTAAAMGEAVASYRRHAERVRRDQVQALAERLCREVESIPAVEIAAVVGSIRRRSDTIGDINLVAASDDASTVIEDFLSLPAVEEVLDRGGDHASIRMHDGMSVDLAVASPRSFSAVQRYRTGSREHNRALEARAHERSLELRPHGLYDSSGGLVATDEAAIYERLGLQVPEPEVRWGAEELTLAEKGRLPRLICLEDICGDLQTHSTYTDGKTSLDANRTAAAALGYEYFAATDHAYELRMVGGLDVADLSRQWAEIDELNASGIGQGLPRILKGIELNIGADGALDYDDEVLASFDIVLASMHSGWGEEAGVVTRRMLDAIAHPLVDVIAHPTGRVLGRRDPIPLDMDEVLAAAGETGTIMEINAYPDRLDLSAEHIRLARRYGVRFSLGTDAHAAEQMRFMNFGVDQARRGMVAVEELLNAQTWDTARSWLKRARVV